MSAAEYGWSRCMGQIVTGVIEGFAKKILFSHQSAFQLRT